VKAYGYYEVEGETKKIWRGCRRRLSEMTTMQWRWYGSHEMEKVNCRYCI